jgi:hypothetical protein
MTKLTGRNDPCPCGSGKKHKKCCLLKEEAAIGGGTGMLEEIMADHPEYADVPPGDEVLVDGEPMRPTLHYAMHEVVENQLAQSDPPEAAETLQRLLDTGADRHDCIHAIGRVMAYLLHSSLTRKEPFDTDEYRRRLRKLRTVWDKGD